MGLAASNQSSPPSSETTWKKSPSEKLSSWFERPLYPLVARMTRLGGAGAAEGRFWTDWRFSLGNPPVPDEPYVGVGAPIRSLLSERRIPF